MKTKLSLNFFNVIFLVRNRKTSGSKNETFGANVSTIILMILLSFNFCLLSSQVPQGFNYQAIARDGTGNPISDPLDVRIAILSDDEPEVVLWEEQHDDIDPDDRGLFSIVVGTGTWYYGLENFSDIDWTVTPKYIRTQIYYSDEWKNMGSSQLWSVPYAMVTDSLVSPLKKLAVIGETTDMEEPLFKVRNNDGNTVFAVYNEGVRVFVGDGSKGVKGGFAIGGFGSEKDENNKKYLFVDDDSVRVYINDAKKSVKGGFAIGGYGAAKGWSKYLKVTSDSTRIVTTDSEQGFGVGSGTTGGYLKLTPDNYFIGHSAGKSINGGKYNSFIGYQAGLLTRGDAGGESGMHNVSIGYKSGYQNTNGYNNIYIGYEAGYTSTVTGTNICIGHQSGKSAMGSGSVFVGQLSGEKSTGSGNTFIGTQTGRNTSSGYQNTYVGTSAGYTNQGGFRNTFLGYEAGKGNTSGNSNVSVGYQAGNAITTGSNNIAIGYNAQVPTATASNQIRMGNASITSASIQVSWTIPSDIRWKESIQDIQLGLSFVNKLKPVDYIRKNNETGKREAGFIAQDIEKLFEEMGIDDAGLLTISSEGERAGVQERNEDSVKQ